MSSSWKSVFEKSLPYVVREYWEKLLEKWFCTITFLARSPHERCWSHRQGLVFLYFRSAPRTRRCLRASFRVDDRSHKYSRQNIAALDIMSASSSLLRTSRNVSMITWSFGLNLCVRCRITEKKWISGRNRWTLGDLARYQSVKFTFSSKLFSYPPFRCEIAESQKARRWPW